MPRMRERARSICTGEEGLHSGFAWSVLKNVRAPVRRVELSLVAADGASVMYFFWTI
jgi:hypothetical protein